MSIEPAQAEKTQYFPVALLDSDAFFAYMATGKVDLLDVSFAYWNAPYVELTIVDHKNCMTFDVHLLEGWDGKPIDVIFDDEADAFLPAKSEGPNVLTLVYEKEGYAPKWCDDERDPCEG
jgi:hypothetical protein